jgi:RecA-family ATPase
MSVVDNSVPNESHGFVRGDDYLLLPGYGKPWIVRHVIPSGGAVNIYGKPKLGKSFCALGLALAVANEHVKGYLGFPIEQHGKVAYFQIDTPRNSWQERLKKILTTDPKLSLTNLYIADKAKIPLPFNITNPEHKHWLKSQLQAIDPVLVVIDVIREIHPFDENDSTPMQKVSSNLFDATDGYATLIVSHARKDQPLMSEDLMSDNRGSNYMAGRMDVVAKLTKKELHIQGRDTEYTKLPVRQRSSDGMVTLEWNDAKKDEIFNELLRSTRGMKLMERARIIAPNINKSPDTTRKAIEEFLKKHPDYDKVEGLMDFDDDMEGSDS